MFEDKTMCVCVCVISHSLVVLNISVAGILKFCLDLKNTPGNWHKAFSTNDFEFWFCPNQDVSPITISCSNAVLEHRSDLGCDLWHVGSGVRLLYHSIFFVFLFTSVMQYLWTKVASIVFRLAHYVESVYVALPLTYINGCQYDNRDQSLQSRLHFPKWSHAPT